MNTFLSQTLFKLNWRTVIMILFIVIIWAGTGNIKKFVKIHSLRSIYVSKTMPISFFSLLLQLEYQRILFGSVIKTRKPKTRHFIIFNESPILFLHFLNHGPIMRKCLLRSLSTFITYKIATWVEHSYLKINGTSLGGGLCPNPDNLGA